MKVKTTPGLQALRLWRIPEAICLIGNLWIGMWNAANGRGIALLSFFMVAFMAGLLMWQQSVIRTRMAQLNPPPRPDYSLIASLERPIWGQAFEHAGAPQPHPGLEELGKVMRAGSTSIRDLMGPLPPGVSPRRVNCVGCGGPHAFYDGHCPGCYRQWIRRGR